MSIEANAAAFAFSVMLAAPTTALGQGAGGPGCTNLPEYNRALGALQGMTSACDMSVEEACQIVAAHGVFAEACGQIRPGPGRRSRGPASGR